MSDPDALTEAAPTIAAALAWSTEDTSPAVTPYETRQRSYIGPAAVFAAVALAGATLIGVALYAGGNTPPAAGPMSQPSAVVPAPAPPAPPPAAKPAPPAPVAPTPPTMTYSGPDSYYLAQLHSDGIPESPAGDPDRIATGHVICNAIADGTTQADETNIVAHSLEWDHATAAALVNDAMTAYCPALMR